MHAFASGFRNVGEAGTDEVMNAEGVMETMTFTDGNAHLDYLNIHFNDNSNIVDSYDYGTPDDTLDDVVFENSGRFFIKNVEQTIVYVSDEDGIDEYTGEGTRTEPLIHRLFFFKNGTFDTNTTATVFAYYGRHGFLASFGDDVVFEQGNAANPNTINYIVTEDVDAECIWNEGVVTTAPTPSNDGVMTYTCTSCGRTKTAPVAHEHAYVVKADGSYYCYDFTNNKIWTECSLTAPISPVVIAAAPGTLTGKTLSVDVTVTATTAITASVFKVDAPSGFVLNSAEVKLGSTESGATGFTATASNTLPCTVTIVRNPVSDAELPKTVVVTLNFDLTNASDVNPAIVRVYDAESYDTSETVVETTTVSAEVIQMVSQGFYLGVLLKSEYVLEYAVPVDESISDCWIVFEKTGEESATVYPEEVSGKWRFAVPGIAAKEMNDTISGTYYYVKDGVFYKAKPKRLNLVNYYTSMASKNAELAKVLHAMFNYGAAAQIYFNYNTENLVSEYIPTAELVDYKTTEVSAVDESSVGSAVEGQIFTPSRQQAVLEQKISMVLEFKVEGDFDIANLVFKGEYRNINNAKMTINIPGEKMYTGTNEKGETVLGVEVDTIAAKDLRQEFTGALYLGEKQVSPTIKTSVEAYVAKIVALDAASDNLKAVCRAMLAYSDAAAEYLKKE